MTLKHVLAALVGCLCLMGGTHADDGSVVDKTISALSRAADATVRGVERGARAAGHGVEVGLTAAANGIKRGAEATSGALNRVGDKIVGRSGNEASANGSAEGKKEQQLAAPPSQSKKE